MEADGKVASNMLNIGRSRHFTSSQMHIYTVLQQGPRRESEAESAPDSPIVSLEYDTLESDGISRGRDRTRRQLRLLFIYPAVYACVWVFPSISDVIGYDEHHSHSQYWLLVASLVSLCAQGLADSIVFCFRERPWRHVRGGFWENLGVGFTNRLSFDSRNETGRNREEMFHDGSRARLRRKGEQVRERASRVSPSEMSSQVLASRNWWDVELDGDEDFKSRDTMSRGRRMARVSDAWRPEQRAD
ncbi:G protein-coupled receptor gpr1 [Diaporthe australafricana]|uniref:G protein-coupled receptor gpr1 n=1 Tax=Diaporthe australafricana TaxID=127596 RepID=A0ABR3XL44_9PEZI